MNVLSPTAVRDFAHAVFAAGPSLVVEWNSKFEQELRVLSSPDEFIKYVEAERGKPRGFVHVAILYPDMAGRARHRRLEVNSALCHGRTWRFETMGWGLIAVYIAMDGLTSIATSVTANSEKRALKWEPFAASHDMDPPSTWNWPAVARHVRRLRLVLRRLQNDAVSS